MKAVVLKDAGKLELTTYPKPKCEKDAIIVKIQSACICNGSDPTMLRRKEKYNYPVVFGHEAYGEIVEVGSEISEFHCGEKVSWWFTMGAFAEYVLVRPKEVAVLKLPDTVPKEEGPIFELVLAASRAVFAAEIAGKRILIQGLGPSGLIMTQLCYSLGAEAVSGIDLYENRKSLGEKYGCVPLSEAGTYDVLIDAYGKEMNTTVPGINESLEYLKDGGTFVLYGQPEFGRVLDYRILQDKQIVTKVPTNDIPQIRKMAEACLEYYMDGKLSLKELVTDVISMKEIPEALELVEKQPDKHIKMIVDIEGESV